MVHLHNGVLLSGKKKNDILKFACKWMELEKNIPSEVAQTQKDDYGYVLTHKWIPDVKQRIMSL